MRLGEFELTGRRVDPQTVGSAKVVIRPERVRLWPPGTTGPNHVPGMVERLVYIGSATQAMLFASSICCLMASDIAEVAKLATEIGSMTAARMIAARRSVRTVRSASPLVECRLAAVTG